MVRPNRISVVGPQTYRRVRISLSGAIDNVAVMFQPCGFHALFGIPTNFLADRTTEGHALLGMTISELYEQLGGLRNFSEREELLNRYFLQCLGNAEAISPVYDSLHQLTVQRYLSIADVARQAGLSRRQLERKSLLYAGITPKTLTRIARFNSALQLGREGLFNWTEVAHMNEYHDHMHLIRDFRAFAGQVPSLTQRQITPDHLINFSPSGFGSTFPAYGR